MMCVMCPQADMGKRPTTCSGLALLNHSVKTDWFEKYSFLSLPLLHDWVCSPAVKWLPPCLTSSNSLSLSGSSTVCHFEWHWRPLIENCIRAPLRVWYTRHHPGSLVQHIGWSALSKSDNSKVMYSHHLHVADSLTQEYIRSKCCLQHLHRNWRHILTCKAIVTP